MNEIERKARATREASRRLATVDTAANTDKGRGPEAFSSLALLTKDGLQKPPDRSEEEEDERYARELEHPHGRDLRNRCEDAQEPVKQQDESTGLISGDKPILEEESALITGLMDETQVSVHVLWHVTDMQEGHSLWSRKEEGHCER